MLVIMKPRKLILTILGITTTLAAVIGISFIVLDSAAFTPLEQQILFVLVIVVVLVVIGYASWFVTKARCPHCGGRRIKKEGIVMPEDEKELLDGVFYSKYRCEKCGHEWLIREELSKIKRSKSILDNPYIGVGGSTGGSFSGGLGDWGGGSTSGGGAGGKW